MALQTVNTIADLRLLDDTSSDVVTRGYHQAGDGGAGTYFRDAADVISADNGGTVIVGADLGRWKLVHDGSVSVRQFGATGDGVNNDHASIQSALGATDLSQVEFPAGTYVITSTLELHSHLLVHLLPGAVIDFSGAPLNDELFFASGGPDAFVPLTADGVAGTRTLQVSSTQGFGVGDWIKVRAEELFDPHRTCSRIGEINRIAEQWRTVIDDEITATSLPLAADLQSTYSTEHTAVVEKVTLVEDIIIRGGTLKGKHADHETENGQTAIAFNFSLNCRVENVSIEQFDAMGILFRNSINAVVTGCRITNARATFTAYGISFKDATADCVASHNHFDEVRHSLSTNTTPDSDHGIVRRVVFAHNTVRSSARALQKKPRLPEPGGDAIDTHAPAEDISIIGNMVLSASGQGINVECPSAMILGNTVNDAHSHGIAAHNESDHNGSVVIANNRIERCAETGILVRMGEKTAFTYTEVVITGNTIDSAGAGRSIRLEGQEAEEPSGGGISVTVRNASFTQRTVSVSGNSIRDTPGHGILVNGVRCGSVTGNSLSSVGGVVRGERRAGISGINIRSVSIGNNSVQLRPDSSHGISLAASGSGATRDCAIVGNTITVTAGALDGAGIHLDGVSRTVVVANALPNTGGVVLGDGDGNVSANNVESV